MKFTSASFLLTENCNLNCKYCFEEHNKNTMTEEVAKAGIDFLIANAIENNVPDIGVTLFGGEPLLNMDIAEYLMDYATTQSRIKRVNFNASIITNGTIMNDRVKKFVKKYVDIMSVQISIDGIKEVHDMYRVTNTGKGSFDMVESNLQDWIDLYKDYPGNFSIHGCSNNKTLSKLFESFKYFFEKWDIERQWYMPINSNDWTLEDAKLYDSELNKIADYLIEVTRKSGNTRALMAYAPLNKCTFDAFPSSPCGAGKTYCTVTAHGHLYPCHQIYFNDVEESMKFGNVLDLDNSDLSRISIFESYDRKDLSCVKEDPDCDAYGCYICIGDNIKENGSILSVAGGCGPRCSMSKSERTIQKRLMKELEKMGLMNSNNNDNIIDSGEDCRCNARSGSGHTSSVERQSTESDSCKCGNKEGKENFEVISAQALTLVIENQNAIMKSIELIRAENAVILKNIYSDK